MWNTLAATDLELRVDGSLAGSPSASLSFPLISVVNGAEEAFGARLDVTLPSQVTLVSVSASNATCSGTSVLRCDFTDLAPGATATVALIVRARVTGSFVSTLKLSASNDSNPANDTREVNVEIAGAQRRRRQRIERSRQWRRRPHRVLDARLVSAAGRTAIRRP